MELLRLSRRSLRFPVQADPRAVESIRAIAGQAVANLRSQRIPHGRVSLR